jgi:hypothetical protein
MIRIHQVWSEEPIPEVDELFRQFDSVEVTKSLPGASREESEEARSKANYVVYMVTGNGIKSKTLVDIVADIINRPKRTCIALTRHSIDDPISDDLADILNYLLTTFSNADFLYCNSLQTLETFVHTRQPSKTPESQL